VILSALFAAGVLLADVTPAAANAAAAVPPAAEAEKKPEDRLVCHNEAQPGSLMTKKVCVHITPRPQAEKAKPQPAPAGGN
jgi:invasion protein IalB